MHVYSQLPITRVSQDGSLVRLELSIISSQRFLTVSFLYLNVDFCLVSLWRGDLTHVSAVRLSVLDFVIFQKRGFEIINLNLSNTTKLILLDSLLQEVTMVEIQIATCLIRPSLYCLGEPKL